MLKINAEAAASPESGGTVSPGSTVISFRPDGTGFQDFADATQIELRRISNGQPVPDLRDLVEEAGRSLGTLVGATFAKGGPEITPTAYPACEPQIVVPADAGEYSLYELTCPALDSADTRAANSAGIVLGSGYRPEDRGTRIVCTWDTTHTCAFLELPDGRGGMVGKPGAINSAGEIALTADMDDRSVRAVRWTNSAPEELGTFRAGLDSGAEAINDDGTAAGWVSLSASLDDRGQANLRPAVWRRDSEVAVLENFGCVWGQVVDINSSGVALVVAYEDATMFATSRVLLWNPADGRVDFVGGDQARGIYPTVLTNGGAILGTARDPQTRSIAGVSPDGRGWERLDSPAGWYATAMNDGGYIAGSLPEDGFERPWIRSPSGEVVYLPYMAYHVCRPTAITETGLVIGTAATDHGSHALLWVPSPS